MVTSEENPDALPVNARGPKRSSMFLAAVLRTGADEAPVRVRNMSSTGAMIETAVTPVTGSNVDLIRGALTAQGTVIWADGNRCGVRFNSIVSVKDWLAPPHKLEQQRVDDFVALVKSGGAGPLPDVDPVEKPGSQGQLVDDIEAVIMLMQVLEDDLAASEETLQRHGPKLQNLDIATQMLRALSKELTPERDKSRVSLARLEDLRIACAQALNS
jgi:PilZ domain